MESWKPGHVTCARAGTAATQRMYSEAPTGTVSSQAQLLPASSRLGPQGLCAFDPHLTVQRPEATLGLFIARAEGSAVDGGDAPGCRVCPAQCNLPAGDLRCREWQKLTYKVE